MIRPAVALRLMNVSSLVPVALAVLATAGGVLQASQVRAGSVVLRCQGSDGTTIHTIAAASRSLPGR